MKTTIISLCGALCIALGTSSPALADNGHDRSYYRPVPRQYGHGDPLFEIWVMRSVQHNLIHQPLRLYDGNAFYPFEYSLAYSEEAISTALVAWPVYLASG
ncbi:MAG: hypothetical protein WBO88_09125, partial [Candidatus Dechloromonas phosphoritropha]